MLLLESVGQHEPQVDTLRNTLCSDLQHAVIPLMAYAKKFEPHLDLLNMDIKEYVQLVNVHVQYMCTAYTRGSILYIYMWDDKINVKNIHVFLLFLSIG